MQATFGDGTESTDVSCILRNFRVKENYVQHSANYFNLKA
jgi:hypothetical protein